MWKEAVIARFNVISLHLPGELRKTIENLRIISALAEI
jgi:hypothetical protein